MIEKMGKNKAKLIVNIGSGKERRRRTKVVTYTGKKDLQRQYEEFEREATAAPCSSVTVNELVASYIRSKQLLGAKPTTIHGYEIAEKRLNSRFKGVLAKDLTTYMVDEFILAMNEIYMPKTIANTIGLLSAAYERAVRTEQLEKNPCRNATLPKRDKKDVDTFDAEQMLTFVEALDNERLDYKVGYKLCLMCGLRRSEVLGLREEDINLAFRCLTVRQTRHVIDGKEYIQVPKNKSSRRVLAIPGVLVRDIEELIEEHHSKPYCNSDYLILDAFCEPLNPSAFSTQIIRIEDRCGLPHVSAHDLRHTFASVLNALGIDIARISAELGHSNINTTLGIYTHVFGDVSASSRSIADAVDDIFSNKEKKPATFLPLKEKKKA